MPDEPQPVPWEEVEVIDVPFKMGIGGWIALTAAVLGALGASFWAGLYWFRFMLNYFKVPHA